MRRPGRHYACGGVSVAAIALLVDRPDHDRGGNQIEHAIASRCFKIEADPAEAGPPPRDPGINVTGLARSREQAPRYRLNIQVMCSW
jgi:hypothetical protein